MQILFEDNHLLVLNKPANWVVQGASPGQKSAFDWSAAYLKDKYGKPGKAFIGVVSRLDAPVTGVLPFARTSKAASRLSEQFREVGETAFADSAGCECGEVRPASLDGKSGF